MQDRDYPTILKSLSFTVQKCVKMRLEPWSLQWLTTFSSILRTDTKIKNRKYKNEKKSSQNKHKFEEKNKNRTITCLFFVARDYSKS